MYYVGTFLSKMLVLSFCMTLLKFNFVGGRRSFCFLCCVFVVLVYVFLGLILSSRSSNSTYTSTLKRIFIVVTSACEILQDTKKREGNFVRSYLWKAPVVIYLNCPML